MEKQRDARLTGVRREIKYRLPPQEGQRALSNLRQRVPEKVIDGSASSFRVSIYLDDNARGLSTAAVSDRPVVTKVRVREYYRLVDRRPQFGDRSFLEVKTRIGQMVEKSRFPVQRNDLQSVLKRGPATPPKDAEEAAAHATFESVKEARTLAPIFVVHYRRFTLQDPENKLRITVDDMITYHLPTDDILATASPRCARADLPPPFFVEPHWIVEIKCVGPFPSWIDEALFASRQISYSKFTIGVQELARRHRL